MLSFKVHGDFNKTNSFFKRMSNKSYMKALDKYGHLGVSALSSATPVDSGETARAWSYEIHKSGGVWKIVWSNSHINKGVNIALILQLGHGTGTGGYIVGRDYINPAIRPIFDGMANNIWEEVTRT